MRILHISVGSPQPHLTALLERELAPFSEATPDTLSVSDGALLRKALCVNAKAYELVLLTGSPALCEDVAGSLSGDTALQPLTLPEGTAGWVLPRFGHFWAFLPEQPEVLVSLLHEQLLPLAVDHRQLPPQHTVGVFGLSETVLKERLLPLTGAVAPVATLYPYGPEWRLRLTGTIGQEDALNTALENVRGLLGQYIYGVDCGDLPQRVAQLLRERDMTAALTGSATDALARQLASVKAPINACASSLPENSTEDIPPIRETAAAARREADTSLGLALLSDETAQKPTIRLALADDKRVWCKTLTGEEPAALERQATTALLDLVRRYLEALPAVIAGGEPIAAPETAAAIPVTPLQKEQPVLFRRAQSRSEGIFKFCLILLIALLIAFFAFCAWYFWLRVPDDISVFKELDELYQTEVSGADTDDYPAGMLPQYYALYNENIDIRGWIRLDAEKSYPVMNGMGGADYSRVGFHRQPSTYGVPYFLPALPTSDGNRCLIVYGNNTGDGQMFSSLTAYLDERYIRAHPTVEMNTIYRNDLWQIFAVTVLAEGDDSFNYTRTAFTDEADFLQFAEELRRRSRFILSTEVTAADDLLLLTTPLTPEEEEGDRLVIAFRRVIDGVNTSVQVVPQTSASQSTTAVPEAPHYPILSEPESSEESAEESAVESEPESEISKEESSEPEKEDGGTEFIEPEPEESEPEPTTVATTTSTTTTTTTKATTTTTTQTTVSTVTETTSSESGSASSETTVSGTEDSTTTASSATSTSATSAPTTAPAGSLPLREGVLNESDYYPLFRLKDSKTGKTLVPTSKEELQLGVFYVLKRELGAASTMVKSTEAQKAQAVAAYTYVLYYCSANNDSSKSSYYYTFAFDSYNPSNASDKKLYKAVGEVLGVKIIYPNKSLRSQAINAMYSCSSAGVSSTCSKVYTANLPYLVSVKSPYDTDTYIKKYSGGRDQSTATFQITYKELLTALAEELDIASAEISAEKKEAMPVYATSWDGGTGGYVYQTNLYYYKSGKKTYIRGKDVRDAVNSYTDLKMRSHSFEVTAYDQKTGTMTICTKGYGHGLGLSQYGAVGYANEAGWTYDQILAHYYSITADTAYQLVAPKW